MPECQYRERPADALGCKVMPEPGEPLCPRHKFMSQLKQEQRHAKEMAKVESGAIGGAGLPKSRRALITAGYQYTGNKECAGCGQRIEWWRTPSGRSQPWNQMPHEDSHATCHFATCTRASSFRRAG